MIKNKKKVLLDLTNLGNPFAGFGQIAHRYAEYFADVHAEDIQFVYLLPNGPAKKGIRDSVSCVPRKTLMKIFPFLLPKVDVWHSVNQQQKVLRKSGKTKFVLTIHDLNFLTEKTPWKAKKYLSALQHKVDKADVITAISRYTANVAKEQINLKGKEIRVIYNGVERIDEQRGVKPPFVKDRPFFFTIGQIRRKKNFHLLIDVMRSFPDYDLYICGDDHFDYAKEVRDQISEKQAENVFLTGVISQKEKVWLYRHCEAFLFPSEGEGFGLPVIEAMQFGKAVFAANRTSLPEICGDAAIMWDDLHPDAMAKSMLEHLPGFYEATERIEKIKKHAQSFGYEKHIRAYLEVYRELL